MADRFNSKVVKPIERLSESLIAKIAAGEVIERPASVVKELVENAIDAEARNIVVEIEEGGKKLVRVSDNGCGMSREGLLMAVERHATNKIRDEADLFRISTLGFRGEALPSIAAVSWMAIESRETGQENGGRLEIEGGKILKSTVCGRSPGTTVTVRNLFFNTPARLKFLKSRETEFAHIASLMEAVALSRPEVGFTLTHQGKKEFQSSARPGHRERIRDLLGAEIERSLLPVSAGRGAIELVGFVSDHTVTSSSAKGLYFYVNGRLVRDRTLQHAILSAYEGLLMKHRYPWAFLYLSVPPAFVDVNVHPTKSEVRFAQGAVVHDLVREGVRTVMRRAGSLTGREVPALPFATAISSNAGNRLLSSAPDFTRLGEGPADAARGSPETSRLVTALTGNCRILGQVHGTYLLCETADKLVLIDQHAAHERIGFEKLKRQFESGGVSRQALLIPKNFELKPSAAEILRLYLEDLEKFGLEVEPFGRSGFVLRAVPALLAGEDSVGLIVALIEELQAFGRLGPLEEKVHEVLETIACHRQIRAGDRLSTPEIEALLADMETLSFSYSCPHGRPSVLQVSFDEIERWFKRRL